MSRRHALRLTETEAILDPEARIEWRNDGIWRVYSPWEFRLLSDERGSWTSGDAYSSIELKDGTVLMTTDLLQALEEARERGEHSVNLADVPHVREGTNSPVSEYYSDTSDM